MNKFKAMQSDKSAASRAIAQNRQLKMQLEELEKAFIQLVKFASIIDIKLGNSYPYLFVYRVMTN
jgi:hypothetical protein